MKTCPECDARVVGSWSDCPLCGKPLITVTAGSESRGEGGQPVDPLPVIRLRYSRKRAFRLLFWISLAVIAASFAAQLLFGRQSDSIGIWRSVWLGLTAMWLVVMMAARKRRNIAKGTVYLLVVVALVCVYWDYLTGWYGWSLTWAVPCLCGFSVMALLIAVEAMQIDASEYIVYSGLTALLGLVPIVFLVLGWVGVAGPSMVCIIISLGSLLALYVTQGKDIRHELKSRLNL